MTVKFAFGSIVAFGFLTTWSVLCAAEPESLTKFCPATEPILVKATGAVEILNDRVLASRAIGCVGPRLPALARQARLEGYVLVGVLVNEAGLVTCAHLISGHPLLVGSALDAARQWIFRPVTQNGRTVSAYGVLAFHYSTGGGKRRSCLDAHW
jgi:TonB family protein